VHVPDVGWVMETTEAVTGSPNVRIVFFDFLVGFFVGLPVAVRHEPTVTAEAFTFTVCSNVVDGV
jgi:hypothetical protein